ncbi:mechanosensitive ion channel domain-containing protein [Stutzerimonas tarimensis]|uniref:Small-conductance mechanosensitive channel n=1 Tax=Stutzerimonas tarimensis TaxID=1507735 RepID=A0ABV7T3C8_9GAMM
MLEQWGAQLLVVLQVLVIISLAFVLSRLVSRFMARLAARYPLPQELLLPVRGGLHWLIIGVALIMVLERFGMSATVLWTAFSGFVAVAAVAFFAMWSVLSNLLCAVFIFSAGPFRLGDRVELIENGEKPGVKGRVLDINLLYTTLEEHRESGETNLVHIPNSLFFQRMVRRWNGQAGAAEPASRVVAEPTDSPLG